MAIKDLTAFLKPDLELVHGDRTFTVPPPTRDVGLKLAAINAAGMHAYLAMSDACPSCGRAGRADDLPEETTKILADLADTTLGELSLGPAYQEMVDAGLPEAHIDQYALYCMYYWVLGEDVADRLLEAQAGGGASGEARPRSTPKPGPPTASASRTRTASTRATGASPKTSSPAPRTGTKPARRSGGATSSTAGT